jgi:retron-type reverse transcriptase
MTGNSSIDISVANVWLSYRAFRKGKKPSRAIIEFESELLENISILANSLRGGSYCHGSYTHMIVNDNKRRDIAVASVRDRVIHRMLYDYLVPIWDKTFIYDAWSCRKNKGLHKAIERAQLFMHKYPDVWVWRADITKLFDSVDKNKLMLLLEKRITDPTALWLLREIIDSYSSYETSRGIPIGNLTSQIFANIYLNEFDRFMKHTLKPFAYLRYGDDWLCFAGSQSELETMRELAKGFLNTELGLNIHPTMNLIKPVRAGVSYLGIDLWPNGRRVDAPARLKLYANLSFHNVSSYKSLLAHHYSGKHIVRFEWVVSKVIDN